MNINRASILSSTSNLSVFVCFENIRRDGLRTAFAGRGERNLLPLIKFLSKALCDITTAELAIQFTIILLGNKTVRVLLL